MTVIILSGLLAIFARWFCSHT